MGVLFRKTFIKTDINSCWDFFSSPENLAKITPPSMEFFIREYDGRKMYEGQQIAYTVIPFAGFKVKWLTEIQSVTLNREFVDLQIEGPYKIWHHRHSFKEKNGGIEMIDVVHYKLPLGLLGKLAEKLIVQRKLKEIFDYREKVITSNFK